MFNIISDKICTSLFYQEDADREYEEMLRPTFYILNEYPESSS